MRERAKLGWPLKALNAISKPKILQVALRTIIEGGENAVSFRALASDLRVTPMAVTHDVGSRHAMLSDLIALTFTDIASEPEEDTPMSRLSLLLD